MENNAHPNDTLIAGLSDGDESVRRRSVEDLGEFGAVAVPYLIGRLPAETDPGVQEAIALVLTRIGGRGVIGALLPLLDHETAQLRNLASEVLVETGKDGVDLISGLLDDDRKDVRKFAADILGDIGDPSALPALIGALDDGDINVACSAAEALGKIGDRRAAEPLTARCRRDPAGIDFYCISALGRIAAPESVGFIVSVLEKERANVVVVLAAVEALGAIGDPSAVGPLRSLLAEGCPSIVAHAVIKALGRIDLASVEDYFRVADRGDIVSTVIGIVDSDDAELRQYAITAFSETDESVAAGLIKAMIEKGKDLPPALIEELMTRGKLSVEALRSGVGSENRQVRETVATVLGDIPGGDPVSVLRELLDDRDTAVRTAALRSIAHHDDPRREELVLSCLDADDPGVRVCAASLAGELGLMAAVSRLAELLEEDDPDVFQAAVSALAALGGEAVLERIRAGIGRDDVRIRERYVELLGMVACDEAARPLLEEVVRDPSREIRRAAVRAIGNSCSGEYVVGTLTPYLGDESPQVRIAAVKAVSRFCDEKTAGLLMPLAGDADMRVRYEAVQALGRCPGDRVVEVLVGQLNVDDVMLRIAACEALGRTGNPAAAGPLEALLEADNEDVRGAAASALLRLDG